MSDSIHVAIGLGGINATHNAVWNGKCRPVSLLKAAGKNTDYIGSRAPLRILPLLSWLLADRGYGADRYRGAPSDKGFRVCIPDRKQRNTPRRCTKEFLSDSTPEALVNYLFGMRPAPCGMTTFPACRHRLSSPSRTIDCGHAGPLTRRKRA